MSLPPVTLFIGPDADVAWDTALDCARRDAFGEHNHHLVLVPPGELTVDRAREIVRLSYLRPLSGYSVICLGLDGSVESVQHSLLKVLEDPSPGVRFVLSAVNPLPTVVSRAVVHRIGIPEALPDWQEELKPAICGAVAAAAAGDPRRLARLTRDWTHKHVVLVEVWAAESFTGRFRVFTKADTQGYGPAALKAVLGELDRSSGVRPRLAAQAALGTLPRR